MVIDYSVIIPAYNEEKTIEHTVQRVYRFLKSQNKTFEIIIADDGSADNTGIIIKSMIKKNNALRLVSYKENKGRGAALSNAFHYARGKILAYVDADLAIDLNLFPKLMLALENSEIDIATGSKHLKGSIVDYPLLRRMFSKAYSLLTRILLNSKVMDYQCGFKAFKKDTISAILPHIKAKRWSWDTEVLVKAQWLGYKIAELPARVVNIYGRESKVHLIKDIKLMGKELIRLWAEKKEFARKIAGAN